MVQRMISTPKLLLGYFLPIVCCYKILHIPNPALSHVYSQYIIGKELVRRGHEVHILAHWSIPYPEEWNDLTKHEGKLIFHTYGNNSVPRRDAHENVNNMSKQIMFNGLGPEYLLIFVKELNKLMETDLLVNSNELMRHLESMNFDVCVADFIFFLKNSIYVPQRLKIPMITYSDIVEPWLVRMPWLPSVYTPMMGIEKKNSTFYDRVTNLLMEISIAMNPPVKDPDDNLINQFCNHCKIKDSKELISESILFLYPEDILLDPVRPCPSNVILIGGLTTQTLREKQFVMIPQDYLDFLEGEDYSGTIVVSFGTLVSAFPVHVSKIFIESFARLPQYKFIWKYTNFYNLTIPKNVKIVDWMAQKDILGHKSVKLFITHSGNNGQFEALYHGVPMLAVFVFFDQPRNARRITEKGYGEEMDLRTIRTDSLVANIKKIVEDPSYKERIMKASEIFKSRPDSPAERAAFWIEHVIKFGGDHLKPAGNDLYFWQYLCLDVLLFLQTTVLVLVVVMSLVICKFIKMVKIIYLGNVDSQKINEIKKSK